MEGVKSKQMNIHNMSEQLNLLMASENSFFFFLRTVLKQLARCFQRKVLKKIFYIGILGKEMWGMRYGCLKRNRQS